MESVLLSVSCGEDADREELSEATASLRRELLELDVEDVAAVPGAPAPAGAKGDPIGVGALVVTLATSGTLTALLATVRSWIERDSSRKVKLQLGDLSLDVEGLRKDQVQQVLDLLSTDSAERAGRPDERGGRS